MIRQLTSWFSYIEWNCIIYLIIHKKTSDFISSYADLFKKNQEVFLQLL